MSKAKSKPSKSKIPSELRTPKLPEKYAKYEPGNAPADVDASNLWFNRLSNRKKAIAIARDSLMQLQLGGFVASQGYYLYGKLPSRKSTEINSVSEFYTPSGFQGIVRNDEQVCNVCAIGAAFVSLCRLGNKHAGDTYGDSMKNALELIIPNYFEFEACFENTSLWCADVSPEFRHSLPTDPTKRLGALMQNIIRNGGKFVCK